MSEFVSFARSCGLEINSLKIGDRISRCPTVAHPRSDNGAYFFDGRRGWCQNWETGEPIQWFGEKSEWSETEKRVWAEQRRISERAKEIQRKEAAARAAELIRTARTDTHPYLKYKSHPEAKALVLPEGELIIPMRDFTDNALLGAQIIKLVDNEWEKKMIFGMRAKGAVFRIGPKQATETFLVEGYATGLSVDTALRLSRLNASVLVCFSAANLLHVSQHTSGRRFVFADNDVSKTGERAAIETGLPYCMSDEIGEDANDLHARCGVMAVTKKIMEVRRT